MAGGNCCNAASSAELPTGEEADPRLDEPEERAAVDEPCVVAGAGAEENPMKWTWGATARTAFDAVAGETNATASNAVTTVVGMRRNFFTRTPPAR